MAIENAVQYIDIFSRVQYDGLNLYSYTENLVYLGNAYLGLLHIPDKGMDSKTIPSFLNVNNVTQMFAWSLFVKGKRGFLYLYTLICIYSYM